MSALRDMTVGELMDLLRGYPPYWSVIPVVNGMQGVITATRETSDHGMAVLIGEVDLPPSLIESLIHLSSEGSA